MAWVDTVRIYLAVELLRVFIGAGATNSFIVGVLISPVTVELEMAALPRTKNGNPSTPNYIDDVGGITPEERENRTKLDQLVDRVHDDYS